MRENTGVFKRGDIWWYRIGRKIRRSSRSTNITDALALRAKAVSAYRHRLVQDEWSDFVREQRTDSNSWLRRTHSHMRRKTRIRVWEDCISLEELERLVLLSDGRCALTGIQFSRETGQRRHPFAISVDRVDSDLGYQTGNVRLVLLAVNLGMSHWGEAAFRQIAKALTGRELVEAVHTTLHSDFVSHRREK